MSQTVWVALLRAINLGGRNRVPMAELREVFEANGAEAVGTYIASGNVVFTNRRSGRAALAKELEAAVSKSFGVATSVVLRTFDEFAAVASAQPFGPDNSNTFVWFLASKPVPKAVRALQSLDISPDCVEVVGADVFVHYPNGVSGARVSGAQLERKLGVPGTGRNWRTVTRVAELAKDVQTR